MKVWLWVLGIIGLAWSGIWFAGAYGTERVMAAWLDARAREGWLVNYDSLETGGYPIRFRTRLEDLELADPQTGWAWITPDFTLVQPSYSPQRIRAIWPKTHTIASPFERMTIDSDLMEAALEMRPASNLALNHAAMDMRAVAVTSSEGWEMTLETVGFTMSLQDGTEAKYDIAFDAANLVTPDPVREMLDPAGILPSAMEAMRFDAVMGFDAPWDIAALERARPGITRIELADLSATWGDLSLRLAGDMDVDADGFPTGEILVRAQNWPAMIEMGVNVGVIPSQMRDTLEQVLGVVGNMSGRPNDIDADLNFRDQRLFFGPIPIGPAPRFVLR